MTIDLFTIFINTNFLLLLAVGMIYYALNIKGLWKLCFLLILVDLVARIIHQPLFQINNVRYVWYLIWATFNFVSLFIIFKLTKEYPNIQKVTIPIGILVLIGSTITIGRHFERNVFSTDFLKQIYGINDVSVSWLILAYLFAPLALLLVKSVRSRLAARH